MSVIGIVCEYNPFHNGHEYHIMMSKKALGADAPVICVMSGDFVQRGEPAVYSKFARAEAACRCGADLVIELPLPWALSSAEGFARGAVGLLTALGASHISFGSESGEIEPLDKIARVLLEPELMSEVKILLSQNPALSYAAAREQAVRLRLGEASELLKLPNNILAVEYLKAIYDLRSELIPMTVQRYGAGHDKSSARPGPKSASELRGLLNKGKMPSEHIPAAASEIYGRERELGRELSERGCYEIAMLSRLRMLKQEDFEKIPDAAEGAGVRLYRACRREAELDSVLASAKTKRYALARIRRMCLCACLGIEEGMNRGLPPYARVLSANEKGCALLRQISASSHIPVITKPASVRSMSEECRQVFAIGAYAHDFYTLAYRAKIERGAGFDWTTSPIIIKNN